ncbi:hypothetical protein DMENIID0001_067110 [Sergentomyia squamirostris]
MAGSYKEENVCQEIHPHSVLCSLLNKFPRLTTHGTLLGDRLGVQPLNNAVHVKAMRASAPHKGTIVSRKSALWTTILKGHPTNTTIIVVCYPSPSCNTRPA